MPPNRVVLKTEVLDLLRHYLEAYPRMPKRLKKELEFAVEFYSKEVRA